MIAVDNSSACFLGHFEEVPFCVRFAQAENSAISRKRDRVHYSSPLHKLHIRYKRYVNSRQP